MTIAHAPTTIPRSGTYRPEIEGLRTVAFLLVAVFHIWFNRVSGGVDVFFTVAGFLITLTLLGNIHRHGRVQVGQFFSRLATRLLPTAAIVLAATVVVMIVLRPSALWRDGFMQVLASATYWENWYLSFNSIDYLAVDTTRSFVQHFWAMSVQGQFYVIWALAFVLVALVARLVRASARSVAFVIVLALVVVSFAWSIYHTNADQQFAYFSTLTRVWEFGAGSLLALVIDKVRIPAAIGALLSWVAVLSIILIGALLPVAEMFPGYVALVPVIAALLIIATGQTQARWGASRLLASRPLVWLGGLGYGVYLWHWPILIAALEVQGRTEAGWKTGIVVILAGLVLAWFTRKFIETPALSARRSARAFVRRAVAVASIAGVVIVAGVSATGIRLIDRNNQAEEVAIEQLVEDPCFGAGALTTSESCSHLDDVPVVPSEPSKDLAEIFYGKCSTPQDKSWVGRCTFGNPDSDTRMLLIGNSHAAVWFPALEQIAEARSWRLDTYYRQACTFNAASRETSRPVVQETCDKWTNNLTKKLASDPPYDYVFTSAIGTNDSFFDSDTGESGPELGIDGYREVWQPLIDRGADIMALRDYPRLSETAAQCALDELRADCVVKQSKAVTPLDEEVLVNAAKSIDGAHPIDMTHMFCQDGDCPTTIGNVRVFRDPAHFTATYAETLAKPLGQALQDQADFPPLP